MAKLRVLNGLLLVVAALGCDTRVAPPSDFQTSGAVVVRGVVREQLAPPSVSIAAATVEITSGPRQGTRVSTNSEGTYVFADVPAGSVTVRAAAAGLTAVEKVVNLAPGVAVALVDFELLPSMIETSWSGTFEQGRPSTRLSGWPGEVEFETTRYGEVSVALEAGCITSGTAGDWFAEVVRASDPSRVSLLRFSHYALPVSSESALVAPGRYRLISGVVFTQRGCPWTIRLRRPS